MASEQKSGAGHRKVSVSNVRDASGGEGPMNRTFPGPRNADAKLRVAVDRSAYAELIAHAKASLDAEVCGVLAGNICADDEGVFVHVEAVIRGTSATEGGTHVTFTQRTWNEIHQTLEREHPKLKIVGWYHTHPGFGVEFSEMDLFIQRNFFPGPAHLALVTDPLNGAVAICFNAPGGIEYLNRFWVDGREQQCRLPGNGPAENETPAAANSDQLRVLEDRVGQLVQALDETRQFHHNFMLVCGFVFCLALMAVAGYSIRSLWLGRLEPPKVNQIVPVPVQVGDKSVILGVAVTSWEVPPELDSILLKAEMQERKEAAKKAAKSNGSDDNATNTAAENRQ